LEEITLYDKAKDLALMTANLADDKLAKDVLVLDLSKIEIAPADFFVICSCDSEAQVSAIANHIDRTCKTNHIPKPRTEGLEAQEWVLMDFFDVVVHIMLEKSRKFYNLEKLWGDADFYTLNEEGLPIDYDKTGISNILGENPIDDNKLS
jgi:ribosome-associated protein